MVPFATSQWRYYHATSVACPAHGDVTDAHGDVTATSAVGDDVAGAGGRWGSVVAAGGCIAADAGAAHVHEGLHRQWGGCRARVRSAGRNFTKRFPARAHVHWSGWCGWSTLGGSARGPALALPWVATVAHFGLCDVMVFERYTSVCVRMRPSNTPAIMNGTGAPATCVCSPYVTAAPL